MDDGCPAYSSVFLFPTPPCLPKFGFKCFFSAGPLLIVSEFPFLLMKVFCLLHLILFPPPLLYNVCRFFGAAKTMISEGRSDQLFLTESLR